MHIIESLKNSGHNLTSLLSSELAFAFLDAVSKMTALHELQHKIDGVVRLENFL
jgi:hypothetical protein